MRAVHALTFTSLGEAAAFVAALSRFLSAPQGTAYRAHAESIAVWGRADVESVDLYLSDAALKAVALAFVLPPVTRSGTVDALPADCALVFDDNDIRAWGVEDAQRRLDATLR